MLDWTPLAVPGLLAAALSGALGAFLWRLDPSRAQNRRVATLLVVAALMVLADRGLRPVLERPEHAHAAGLVTVVLATLLPALLLRFVATMESRWAKPFRVPAVEVGVWTATAVALVVWTVEPSLVLREIVALRSVRYWSVAPGVGIGILDVALLLTTAYGVFVAFSAMKEAKTSERHAQARAHLLTLAIFGLVPLAGAVFWSAWSGAQWVDGSAAAIWMAYVLPSLALAVVAGLFVWAALKHQRLDVRLKTRLFVKQGTLVGVFTFVVVGAGEWLERLIPLPGVVLGIAAAVILGLLMRPLQTLAGRVAERLVPDPLGTGLKYSHLQVYRSAIAGAFGDGDISPKEQKTLRTLREQLGVDDATAEAIEREVRAEMRRGL